MSGDFIFTGSKRVEQCLLMATNRLNLSEQCLYSLHYITCSLKQLF